MGRMIFRHLWIGLAGSLVLLVAVPLIRAFTIRQEMGRTEGLLQKDRAREALEACGRLDPAATRYPQLARRLACQRIEALVRLADFEAADILARAVLEGRYPPAVAPADLRHRVQQPATVAINGLMARLGNGTFNSPWCGYAALTSALERSHQESQAQEIYRSLCAKYVNCPFSTRLTGGPRDRAAAGALSVRNPVRAVTPPNGTTTNATVAEPPAATNQEQAPAVESGPSGERGPENTTAPVVPTSRSEEEKRLRNREAELVAQLESAKRASASRPVPQNPHAQEYARARKAYDDFWKKAKDLEKKMNASTGAERIRYGDQLRLMKGEDIRIGQALQAAWKKLKDWQDKQTSNAGEEQIPSLDTELADVRNRLRAFGDTTEPVPPEPTPGNGR